MPKLRQQFPSLQEALAKNPLVYLDSAATTLRPQPILDALEHFYVHQNSNPHRSMHVLAEAATQAYENARSTVATFLNAKTPAEIIFTRNTTEAINLVARSWGELLHAGDVIALTQLEHHSNIVPWQQLAERNGLSLRWIPCNSQGEINIDDVQTAVSDGRVKLLAITAQSNVLGTMPDLQKIIKVAHKFGALVLVDAAQWVAHHPTNVQAWDCDFLAFSGHKVYGPMGIGVLYGKRQLLENMPSFIGGGSMVQTVTEQGFTPADIPQKFEAGTPAVADAIGLAAALKWLQHYAWEDIQAHEQELLCAALKALRVVPGLTILGPAQAKHISGAISFTTKDVHPHDLTDALGKLGICLRAGHQCAAPLHTRLGLTASSRLSFGIYNTTQEVEMFSVALQQLLKK
jgi:cysteine desulfurase / selenocysteine lyase